MRGKRESEKRRTALQSEINCPLGCEKIPTVQHGDDLAAHEQFFEVVALAQVLIAKDALPEVGSDDVKFGLAKEIDGDAHALTL